MWAHWTVWRWFEAEFWSTRGGSWYCYCSSLSAQAEEIWLPSPPAALPWSRWTIRTLCIRVRWSNVWSVQPPTVAGSSRHLSLALYLANLQSHLSQSDFFRPGQGLWRTFQERRSSGEGKARPTREWYSWCKRRGRTRQWFLAQDHLRLHSSNWP